MKTFILSAICSAFVSGTLLFGGVSYAQLSEKTPIIQVEKARKPSKRCYPYDKYYLLKKWLPLYIAILAILFIYIRETNDRKRQKKIASLSKQLAELQDTLGEADIDLKERQKIGQEYEKYVARHFRRKGYTVNLNGVKKGFDDEGIDLICSKNGETLLIQCKNWAKEKIIHENYIFQLYGAWKFYEKAEKIDATAYFYCTCKVTNQARIIARILGIKLVEEFKMLN